MPPHYLHSRNEGQSEMIRAATLIMTIMGTVQVLRNIHGRPFPFTQN